MRKIAWQLLTLIAVLLMPFGMQGAAAAPSQHHRSGAVSGAMSHCPDQRDQGHKQSGVAQCTMLCSTALPAADLARGAPPLIVCEPPQPTLAHRLHGLHPDIGTPPPKRS